MDELTDFQKELEIQKNIAYTAGILQGDITIKTLFESLAEGVVIVDENGRIILINNRLGLLTGYEPREVMGQSMNIFIPEEFHKKHQAHLKGYFAEPRIRPMGIGLELTARRKDGSVFPIEISLSNILSESGRLGIGFITDISSRKNSEDELRKRNIELNDFAHTVAHDLNSSLSGIVGFSELLIDAHEEMPKEEHEAYLKEIAQSGRKMSNIIRELLIFATMKKEDVDLCLIDMKEVIVSACQRLKYQLDEKSVQLRIADQIHSSYGYAPWIEEIWFNYISNAIKYGGKSPTIIEIYSSQTNNGYIKYSVRDNGAGISDETKLSIFSDSRKSKDGYSKGFGLGLSIVKRIVEKFDGYVSVESVPEKGSEFSFYLKEN